ncbi:nuclear pore membrane glycoprotein 210-like isoform X5 [Cygnus olor]|uniref:nuclear pore membrane glycoprotein 210-like isoform X5 n=1 Tax=Cygnus olor TaxID=8869 RepID=UPI001ADEBD58|nr:nuclear pore membrane glycoprotein 210-like isoform X5 [Cygnus olor]
MGRARLCSLLFLPLVFFVVPVLAFKLNVPKALLPFSRELRVPFVLEAEGGCYSWYSTHNDIVTVESIYENGTICSQKALLSARSSQATKLSSVVIAEERVTGHLLRCDVIVDVINSIEIISRTREIYVEDSPLELAVRALDVEGNTFSSLSGMTFEWSIAKDDDIESLELSNKVSILKYSEADYSPPDYIVEMEKAEKQGDRILVSGIKTGAAVIKVRMQESTYKKVAAASIRLLVLENILLIPSHDVYLLVGAYIKYQVAKLVRGKMTDLEFPLEHYDLELCDQVIGPGGSDLLPVASLENLRIIHHFSKEYFEELISSRNGSYHIVQVLKDGITGIKAELVSVLQQDGSQAYLPVPVSHEQEVKIYLPIKLSPSLLAFPHHPTEVLYRYNLQVEGGSGNFSWISSNQTVVTVTIKGVVTGGLAQGHCTVQARDVQNPFHYGEIQVYVEQLAKVELLPFRADIEIGQILEAPLKMYFTERETRQNIAFTDCSLLPLDISMEKQGVFVLAEEGNQKPGQTFCSSFQLEAKSVGHTLLTASITVHQEHFETSAVFAAYEPLKAVNPVEMALVTWQAAKEMVFEGGPGPWVLEPSRFFSELTVEHKEKIEVVQVRFPTKRKLNQYVYQVVCLQLGEQVLTFQVGNRPGLLNPAPAVEAIQVTFICAHPASMSVTPMYEAATGIQPCPLPQQSKQLIPVSSVRSTVLELAVFDHQRRKFDNFSSLVLEWKSFNETLAHFSDARTMKMVAKDDGTGQTQLHGHQLLEVHQIKGTVFVGVSFVKYTIQGGPKEVSNLLTSASVEFLLVEDVTIVPDNATMYNHPAVKELFDLVEGSGYFLVNSSEGGIVNMKYREAESAIEVTPLQPGFLSLEIYDLCLALLEPVAAYLHVSDMYEVEVHLTDKLEIGKSVIVTVQVLGFQRLPLQSKYFKYMKLELQAASPIVTLAQMKEVGEYSELHVLHAVAAGQTTLVATAWDKMGRRITSAPRKVEVFPPFKLIPKKMTLIPHNMVQVMSEGGPQPQSSIHFSVTNSSVAEVNRLGQVTARTVGTTTIQGAIRVVSEDTGGVTVFSQDQMELEVVQLKAVRIHVPATRLITGTEMPVFVVGLNNMLTPFSFSNANPELRFQWSVSKRDVLDLLPRHMKQVSIQLQSDNNVAMVVHTKSAGRTSIKVMVQCLNASAGQFEGNVTELSDEVQILVFDKLSLFSPSFSTEQILMSTNSQLKLYTNREGAAFVSFQILQCYPNSSILEEHDQGVLRAGPITGIAVLEVTSLELFGVNQTTVTGIRVAPISYLRINISPKIYTAGGMSLATFPLGMSLTITVEFYNSIGEKFHAQNAQLRLSVNRDDLLLIRSANKNHTYIAQAVNRGVTLLTVQDERHPGVADYIPVPVEPAIKPDLSKPVAVGDVICFSSPLVNQEGASGMWRISPSDKLDVDSVSGAALVKNTGTATVFHDIPGIGKTYREVVVNGSSNLSFQIGQKNYLTNAPDSSAFHVLVATSSGRETLKGPCSPLQLSAITNRLLPESYLKCGVGFSSTMLDVSAGEVFLVQSGFSIQEGLYACVITAKPQPSEVLLALSLADASVYVTVSHSSDQRKGDTQRILVPFLPAFYLYQSELVFSITQLTGVLRVLGVEKVLEKLEVQPSSPALTVMPPERSLSMPGLVSYVVGVVNFTSLQQMPAPAFVNVSCALTAQRAAVAVRALTGECAPGQCREVGVHHRLASSYQVLLFTLFAVSALTAVMFLAHNAFLTRLQTVPVVYVPTAAVPQTGYSCPASSQHERNRPQLGLWSVRR